MIKAKIYQFLRNWSLPIAMVSGVLAYLLYVNIPLFDSTHDFVATAVSITQPWLIFAMLFMTFCKVRISDLKPSEWHPWLLVIQIVAFLLLSLLIAIFPGMPVPLKVMIESVMLCLMCPTATAAAVITARLGGNYASLISYTIQINIAVAVAAPLFLSISHPVEGLSLLESFLLIMAKVFPLLLCPMICAELTRHFFPAVHRFFVTTGRNWSFYHWLLALSLAIAMTTRAIVHSGLSFWVMASIAIVSLACCLVQFVIGRKVGERYGDTIAGGQALGQKNTVFAIWFACTFLTPVTAIAGGFYAIWHNLFNTWQMYIHNHAVAIRKRRARKGVTL